MISGLHIFVSSYGLCYRQAVSICEVTVDVLKLLHIFPVGRDGLSNCGEWSE